MRLLVGWLLLGVAVGLFQGGAAPAGQKGQPQAEPGGDPAKGDKGDDPKQEPDDPKDIVLKGKITKSDPLDTARKDSHCKVHTLKLDKGFAYFINFKADPHPDKDMPSFDTFLRLEDAAGKQLAENDDYITTDSRIIFSPEKTGQYRVVCTTFDAGATGSYTLTVSPNKGQVADGGILVLSTNDKLINADPFDTKRTASHAKIHTVKLVKGKTYQVSLNSNQFQTYLRVEDAKGKQLAEDNSNLNMGGLNSSVSVTATKTGDYRVIVTTNFGNQVGAYTLKVTQR